MVALLFAVGLFFVVPVSLTSLFKDELGSAVLFWLVEGLVRTAIFLGSLVVIVRLRDLRREFELPRRRAHDDRVLRGRPAAHAGERPAGKSWPRPRDRTRGAIDSTALARP